MILLERGKKKEERSVNTNRVRMALRIWEVHGSPNNQGSLFEGKKIKKIFQNKILGSITQPKINLPPQTFSLYQYEHAP